VKKSSARLPSKGK